MKCEKCNEREANVFYTATINGQTTQRHLCGECAREEGLDRVFRNEWAMANSMLGSFFGMHRTMNGGLMDGFMSMPMITFPAFMAYPGQLQAAPAPVKEAAEEKIPDDAGDDIKAKRALVKLRHELDEAVRAENFEKAIEIRNQIKKLEG